MEEDKHTEDTENRSGEHAEVAEQEQQGERDEPETLSFIEHFEGNMPSSERPSEDIVNENVIGDSAGNIGRYNRPHPEPSGYIEQEIGAAGSPLDTHTLEVTSVDEAICLDCVAFRHTEGIDTFTYIGHLPGEISGNQDDHARRSLGVVQLRNVNDNGNGYPVQPNIREATYAENNVRRLSRTVELYNPPEIRHTTETDTTVFSRQSEHFEEGSPLPLTNQHQPYNELNSVLSMGETLNFENNQVEVEHQLDTENVVTINGHPQERTDTTEHDLNVSITVSVTKPAPSTTRKSVQPSSEHGTTTDVNDVATAMAEKENESKEGQPEGRKKRRNN